jgi:multimeric flavodoxin WrbA
MMILGVSGSPRKGGNTEYILDEALKVASERGFKTQQLLCSSLEVRYCDDGMIISSPVYFGTVTAQIKAVFDRTILLRRQGFKLKDKVGCALTVGASRNGGAGEGH